MAINYDPSAQGGASFGNKDYEHLKSKGHSDSEINNYISGLDNSKVSNKYKGRGGHQRTAAQTQRHQSSSSSSQSNPQQQAKQKAINYDPSKHGGASFGDADYDYLKSEGHSKDEINNYISTLGNKQVSNKYKGKGGHERTEAQQNKHNKTHFTTAAGYEMERGAYNQSLRNMSADREVASKEKYGDNHNSWGYGDSGHYANFDKDGYLNHDSTKVQWQNQNMLKEAGYKAGDTLWRPGAKDDLNGRTLTGKIARITESGIYIPEYEHDAINSSHQSTGNAGYQGEVGLGADQYNYNRQYEQENDVEYGQVNQQLQANGVSDQGIDDYWEKTDAQRQSIADMRSGASNYSGQQSFTNYGSSQSDFETPPMAASNFEMPNVQQSIGAQYQGWQEQMGNASQSPYATRSKSSNMNFNFSPYKFQQGQ